MLLKMFCCCIEAVFRAVVRPPKKNIEGQIVLITGKAVTKQCSSEVDSSFSRGN